MKADIELWVFDSEGEYNREYKIVDEDVPPKFLRGTADKTRSCLMDAPGLDLLEGFGHEIEDRHILGLGTEYRFSNTRNVWVREP